MSDALTLLVATALALLLWSVLSYNRFVSQQTLVQSSWSHIDVELQRRYDLIPNLVATVRAYAAFESRTLEQLIAARTAAMALAPGSPAMRTAPEVALTSCLHGVLALAEGYPELRASTNFLHLQQQLVTTEDRLSAARRFYNGNVNAYNTRLRTAPSSLVARAFGFTPVEFFEAEDAAATAPRID